MHRTPHPRISIVAVTAAGVTTVSACGATIHVAKDLDNGQPADE
jgi:hypothetical protein